MNAFGALWASLKNKVVVSKVEWIVGDDELGIAGTVDTVFCGDTGIHIWDWKTGKEFKINNPWGKNLLPPFNDLPECELSIYSLQVSIYKLIIERNTDLVLNTSYLVHLSEGGYQIYPALDLTERVKQWLQQS